MNDNYIIITPAFNEEKYIESTIKSVLSQSIKPVQWLIVDDGSTDGMADIINKYASKYSWIKCCRREKEVGQTYYCSNVYAIMEGYNEVKDKTFDYLAILDADIDLPENYYEIIISRMQSDVKIGVASGVYQDLVDGKLIKVLNDRRSTPKALQVFRGKCFDQIGGYLPMKFGGEDTVSCVMARMNGWKSWSFPDVVAVHNKPVGRGHSSNILKIRFRQGINEFGLATHPLFMFVKCIKRSFKEKPLFLSGTARFLGFVYGYFLGEKRQIDKATIKFIRKEQFKRLFLGNNVPDEYRVDYGK